MGKPKILHLAEAELGTLRQQGVATIYRPIQFNDRAMRPDTEWIASVNPDGRDGWIAWGPRAVSDETSRTLYPNGGGFRCPYGKKGEVRMVKVRGARGDGLMAQVQSVCVARAQSVESESVWDALHAAPSPVRHARRLTHYVSYPWQHGDQETLFEGLPWKIYGNPWLWGVRLVALAE
jgi:hypothetical protein